MQKAEKWVSTPKLAGFQDWRFNAGGEGLTLMEPYLRGDATTIER